MPSAASGSTSAPQHCIRETVVLDLVIVLKVHDATCADEAELQLGQPEVFRHPLYLIYPRARLEDLFHVCPASTRIDLSPYSVAPRRVVFVGPSRRTTVDVELTRDESLEVTAKRLMRRRKDNLAVQR